MGLRQIKFVKNLPTLDFTTLSEGIYKGLFSNGSIVDIVSESDVNKTELLANMGTVWGAEKLATLGGFYTELDDSDNMLAT